MNFLDNLYNNLEKRNLRVKLNSVLYDEDDGFATFKFEYDQEDLAEDDKTYIKNEILDYFPDLNFDIKFKKYFFDKPLLSTLVKEFIMENYTSIVDEIFQEDIYFEGFNLIIKLTSANLTYLENSGLLNVLYEYLNGMLFDEISISLIKKDDVQNDAEKVLADREEVVLTNIYSQVVKNEVVLANLDNITPFIGEEIKEEAFYPEGLKTEADNINIAGEITYFNKKSYIAKRKDADGNDVEKEFFTFDLKHNNSKIRAVYFPRIADLEKAITLENGMQIIVNGRLEFNQEKLSLRVRNISLCEIIEEEKKEEIEIEYRKANDKYLLVEPKEYYYEEQANFFDIVKEPSDFLKNHEFVVFDLETTGTEVPMDEITEIGAVKVINGRIAESFTTLVKPKQSISEKITKITGIDDELVKDAPSIEEVLPDFYKFCDGAVLVAYNIDFDYKFIDHYGLKMAYKFSNPQIDAMYLARVGVPGLKRFRLKDVVERLQIPLVNAHRALNDTIATAKVFIELAKFAEDLI